MKNTIAVLRWPMLCGIVVSAAGCYSEADYAEDYWSVNCSKIFACYDASDIEVLSYSNEAECLEYFAPNQDSLQADVESETCTFDGNEASTCIQEFDELSCEDFMASELPEACHEICEEWGD